MPYIKNEDKQRVCSDGISIELDAPNNAGELNFALTELCRTYFAVNGSRYQQINDVIGALEGCKLEFYRRLAAPYEDTKIKENGDVY